MDFTARRRSRHNFHQPGGPRISSRQTVRLPEPKFFKPHPDACEPVLSTPESSPFIFRWEDVSADLERTKSDPEGRVGRRVELGGPALSSIALYMQRHAAGETTRAHRTTANQIVCIAEGSGTSTIDGERFDWSRGDVLPLPAWRPFSHRAAEDAVLFVMTDEPVLRSIGWLRLQDC